MQRMLGKYEIIERVAVGGHAEIFLARIPDAGAEQRFALKVLLPQYAETEEHRKMLIDEALLTAQLAHPNIVQVYGVEADDETLFMIMEYVDGFDLGDLIERSWERRVQVPLDVAAYLIAQVCAALHFAHTRLGADGQHLRLVHRDVSPRNVLVGMNGDVKLLDFGVAKADSAGRMETKTGIIKGKLAYMAPEYAGGELQDPRADVFSTALCLYELVTGRPAYDRSVPARLVQSVKNATIHDASAFRPELTQELASILERGLHRSPTDRFQSADQMHQALLQFLAHRSPGFGRDHIVQYLRDLVAAPEESGEDDDFAEEATTVTPPSASRSAEPEGLAGFADLAGLARGSEGAIIEDPDEVAILETMAMSNPSDSVLATVSARPIPVRAPEGHTATDLDVAPLRQHPGAPEILTASGFQRHMTAAEVQAIRSSQPVSPFAAAPAPIPSFAHAPEHGTNEVGARSAAEPLADPTAQPSEERSNHVFIVALLGVLFVGLLFWVFFG